MIQIKKKMFKKGTLNKASDLWKIIFLKYSQIDKKFAIPACFIISNDDSNQFEFNYLTKLQSTFKVMPR